MTDIEELIWAKIQQLMPKCDGCGERLKPGGLPNAGIFMLVCTNCSFMGEADPEWVADVVATARGAVARGQN